MLRRILTFPLLLISWLSDGLARCGRVVEMLTVGVLNSVDRASSVGSGRSRFFAWLLWPFAAIGDLLDRFGIGTAKPLFDVDADQQTLERRLRKQQSKDAWRERVENSWALRIGAAFLMPLAFAWTLLSTRRRALLWWSLPILLVGGTLGFVVYQTAFVNKERIAARYEAAVAEAISTGEFKQAELFQRKLEQLGVRTDQGEYQTARAIGESGDVEAAAKRMEAIATPDAPGNPGAHFWLAHHLIYGKIARYPQPESCELALAHLNQLKRRVGSLAEIELLEGIALAKLGRLDEAAAAFGESPRLLLEAARAKMHVDLARHQTNDAKASATIVQRHLNNLKTDGTKLTAEQHQLDLKSAQLLGDSEATATAVRTWYESNPDNPDAKHKQATLLIWTYDRWLANPVLDEAESAVEQLVAAADLVPAERVEMVPQRLDLIAKRRDQPEMQAIYQTLLASPKTPGMALEVFATDAAMRQEWEAADKIFAIAAVRSPVWDPIWNNWAYVLDRAFPDRREEAILYAKKATELKPENADYRETYGTLLLHVGRWEEAIEQLEIAVNGLSNTGTIHKSLANAYDQVGNARLANLHRQAAER